MAISDPSDPRFVYQMTPGMQSQLDRLDEFIDAVGGRDVLADEDLGIGRDFYESDNPMIARYEQSFNLSAGQLEALRRAKIQPTRGSRYESLSEDYAHPDQPDGVTRPAKAFFSKVFDDRVESPTASSFPDRPRTLAAFYEPLGDEDNAGVVTLMFRDGTLYNYYDVSVDEWKTFRGAPSKGGIISNMLDGKSRGPADVSSIPAEYRSMYAQRARQAQYVMGGRLTPYHKDVVRTKKNVVSKRPAAGTMKQARSGNKKAVRQIKRTRTLGT